MSTTQARETIRAERHAAHERYMNAASDTVSAVASILTGLGFAAVETVDRDGTPVTTWHDLEALATVKQTPYTVKFYNGRPARLRKSADAEYVYRVEHGWQPRGHAAGYVAGIAAAFEQLIESDDTGYGFIGDILTPEEQAFKDSLPPVELPRHTLLHNHHYLMHCQRCQKTISTYVMLGNTHYCEQCADILDPLPELLTVNQAGERKPVTAPPIPDPWDNRPIN